MKRSAFDSSRDQRIADSAADDRDLMCTAHGCPLRWSVNFSSPLCSAHGRADPQDWPRVTQWLQDAEAERIYRAQYPDPPPAVRKLTPEERRAIGANLRIALRQAGGRAWAERLRDREESGARLTDAQRAMWRAALGRGAARINDDAEFA